MRRPKYFVSFGGFNLQNVTNVHDENGRELSEYDSVGAGKFNVPDARKPHTWKIDCELWEDPPAAADSWRASEIFKAMNALLNNSTDPSRLVITDSVYPAANLSVLAWFKNYSRDEVAEGQYKTTVELEEYIPVGGKTTDVPYVARPGKVPVPPKVTVKKSGDVYTSSKKTGVGTVTDAKINTSNLSVAPYANLPYTQKVDLLTGKPYLVDKLTGKPLTNPASAKSDTYIVKNMGNGVPIASVSEDVTGNKTDWSVPANAIKKTFQTIGSTIDSWVNNASTYLLGH